MPKSKEQFFPNFLLSIEERDVHLSEVPALRHFLEDCHTQGFSNSVFVPARRHVVYKQRKNNYVSLCKVESIAFDIRRCESQFIRVDVISNFSRLSVVDMSLIKEYCVNIMPLRRSKSANDIHGALSDSPAFLAHIEERCNFKRIWEYENIKQMFPELARSSWQRALSDDHKRSYTREADHITGAEDVVEKQTEIQRRDEHTTEADDIVENPTDTHRDATPYPAGKHVGQLDLFGETAGKREDFE